MSHTLRRRKDHKAWQHTVPVERAPTAAPAAIASVPKASARKDRDWLVTDHAILRWIERVTGIDVARQVRDEILAEGREALIPRMGNGKILVRDSSVVLQVVAGRVVTVKTRAPIDG